MLCSVWEMSRGRRKGRASDKVWLEVNFYWIGRWKRTNWRNWREEQRKELNLEVKFTSWILITSVES